MLRGTPCCTALLRATRRTTVRRGARRAGPGNALPRAGQVGDGASMGSLLTHHRKINVRDLLNPK